MGSTWIHVGQCNTKVFSEKGGDNILVDESNMLPHVYQKWLIVFNCQKMKENGRGERNSTRVFLKVGIRNIQGLRKSHLIMKNELQLLLTKQQILFKACFADVRNWYGQGYQPFYIILFKPTSFLYVKRQICKAFTRQARIMQIIYTDVDLMTIYHFNIFRT